MYIYTRADVYTSASMRIYNYVRMYVRMYICTYVCICVCVCVCMYVCKVHAPNVWM